MKGGAINYLPLPYDITDAVSLESKVAFVSVTGHGVKIGKSSVKLAGQEISLTGIVKRHRDYTTYTQRSKPVLLSIRN
jgi:hypothetical protein